MRTNPPPATVLNMWGMQVSLKTSPSQSPCALTCATCLRAHVWISVVIMIPRAYSDIHRRIGLLAGSHTSESACVCTSHVQWLECTVCLGSHVSLGAAIMIAVSVRGAVWSSERAKDEVIQQLHEADNL